MITSNDNKILQFTQLELSKFQCYENIRKCAYKIYHNPLVSTSNGIRRVIIHVKIERTKVDYVVLDFYTQIYTNGRDSIDIIYNKLIYEIEDVCKGETKNYYQYEIRNPKIDLTQLETYKYHKLKDVTFII